MMLCMPRSLIGNCVLDIFESSLWQAYFSIQYKTCKKENVQVPMYIHFLYAKIRKTATSMSERVTNKFKDEFRP